MKPPILKQIKLKKMNPDTRTGQRLYRVAMFKLNQTGTAAPVATVLFNSTNYEFAFTRTSSGYYEARTVDNDEIMTRAVGIIGNTVVGFTNGRPLTSVIFSITTAGTNGFATDGNLVNTYFELRIYSTT